MLKHNADINQQIYKIVIFIIMQYFTLVFYHEYLKVFPAKALMLKYSQKYIRIVTKAFR